MIRKTYIPILKVHYLYNLKSETFYRQCFRREKKIYLRNLIQKLYTQKAEFNRDFSRYYLSYNKQRQAGHASLLPANRKNTIPRIQRKPFQRLECQCLELEQKSLKLYQNSLKQVTDGELRSILLNHRHKVATVLENVEVMNKYII